MNEIFRIKTITELTTIMKGEKTSSSIGDLY